MEDTWPILKMEVVMMDKLPKDLPKEEKLNYILQLIDKDYDRKNDLFKAILRACKKFLILLYLLKMLNFSFKITLSTTI